MDKLFLLSPASTAGRRAQLLLNRSATFPLARKVQTGNATLGEVFSFLSGLYFRGKLGYALHFGEDASTRTEVADSIPSSSLVITSSRGLLPPSHPVTLDLLHEFAEVPIDLDEPRYCRPLRRSLEQLHSRLDRTSFVVLLGSIASDKYSGVLLPYFQERLVFPEAFVGRGDMSRGGLLLRAVRSGTELTYQRLIAAASRRGPRPPRLHPS